MRGKETDRDTERGEGGEHNKGRHRQAGRQTDKQTDRLIDSYTSIYTKETERLIWKKTDRQRETERER